MYTAVTAPNKLINPCAMLNGCQWLSKILILVHVSRFKQTTFYRKHFFSGICTLCEIFPAKLNRGLVQYADMYFNFFLRAEHHMAAFTLETMST